jgi:hypothetical protein
LEEVVFNRLKSGRGCLGGGGFGGGGFWRRCFYGGGSFSSCAMNFRRSSTPHPSRTDIGLETVPPTGQRDLQMVVTRVRSLEEAHCKAAK